MDPDGKVIIPINDIRLSNAIMFLYTKSEIFKKQFNRLLSETNVLNQKVVVLFSSFDNQYPGNTQTNDSPISYDSEMLRLDNNGDIEKYIEPKTEEKIQAIFVNVDINKIYRKKLDLLEIISEEICHAADTMNYGSECWNKKCEEEDQKYKYMERPREVYAKELTKQILEEINE